MTETVPPDVREARDRSRQIEHAALVRAAAQALDALADAMAEGDDIAGEFAGRGILATFPALPRHIREALTEQLDDEAARGYRAEMLYVERYANGLGIPPELRRAAVPGDDPYQTGDGTKPCPAGCSQGMVNRSHDPQTAENCPTCGGEGSVDADYEEEDA